MTRAERFTKLIESYGHEPDDYDAGEEEDPRIYLDGTETLERFCCVTAHGEKTFFLPAFDAPAVAMARAVEYATDNIWAETPVAVVDLDTGREWKPMWETLDWRGPTEPSQEV